MSRSFSLGFLVGHELRKAGCISPIYGRFRDATGGISLIYGSLFLKNEAFHTPYLLFRQTGLPYISEKPPDKSVNLPCISEMRAMHIEVMSFVFADVLGIPVENVAVNELGGLGDAMCSAVGTGLYKDFQEALVIAVARMDSGHTNHSITIDHESRTNYTLIDLAVQFLLTIRTIQTMHSQIGVRQQRKRQMLSGYWRIDADVIASYGSSDFVPI